MSGHFLEEEPRQPQYYATFDDNGNISAFYVDIIHGDNIPKVAMPISTEEWQHFNDIGAYRFKLDGGAIREKTKDELDEEVANQPPLPPTPEERIGQLEEVNAELWYEVMLKDAKLTEHDGEIADLWYEIMTGGAE